MDDTGTRRTQRNTAELRAGSRLYQLLGHGSKLPRARRRLLYAGIALAVLLLIWIPTGLVLLLKPATFTSSWSLILPGSGTGHAVSLDSVGQASATVSSPYNSHSVDPKVNYRAIAESEPVLSAAATAIGMQVEEFGKPRIKLADQTALMIFRVTGNTPDVALAKSEALYTALQAELERLRSDELARRETGIRDMLSGFSEKLREAQQRILDYQAGARIVSLEQFNEQMLELERLRGQVRELKAERAGVQGQLESLQDTLQTDAHTAASLLDLQQDALFRQLAKDWAAAAAQLTRNRARWGSKHEQVIGAEEDERELRNALRQRARALAPGIRLDNTRQLARGPSDPELYIPYIELHAERHGLDGRITSIVHSIAAQQQLLEQSTTDASNLEDLKRRHQVATAVFTTALAKLDIGKSDRFSSYPLVQLLARPTRPAGADTLGRNLALLGATTGSLFSLLGLYLLWIRKPYFQRLLKNG
jgi:uncharacterized protein involved in exopolysaccharide biosynthesis